MILDGHIHITGTIVNQAALLARMKSAGVDGGILISLAPSTFPHTGPMLPVADRLDNVLAWTKDAADLFPFFWIDPLDPEALAQVDRAVARGIRGFKVICNHFYPGDERAMKVYGAIAAARRPILFHSGILWDGQASSRYNQPVHFEPLLEVKGLRFAVAHISWPWCDECIAVYGKFRNSRQIRPDLDVEMFIDLTPGTPPMYRRDALTKLLTIGYGLETNLLFGTDSSAGDYAPDGPRHTIARDNAIYAELKLSPETLEQIYSGNLRRFLGPEDKRVP